MKFLITIIEDGRKVSGLVRAENPFEVAKELELNIENASICGNVIFWSWICMGKRCSFLIMPVEENGSDLEKKEMQEDEIPDYTKLCLSLN
ncbi:MAG: hypothetical protein A2390_00120 [Candidatus Liptonbacteria bacterium RIFOXYB1_FULL_36_10]|uniref:Uncharacterized protein n=2 Tax=Candidatus Liptoniibacteriota TaxID=1817909 RepID=A0A1G2CQI2_9BACT|nr:MAG: hypothetical protein A2390_00120 [Candidatus Liptonbacteria bacterium RIFOXYB1_FULL_36_10]OGZ03184.1 MAG: hypothetical protein A2604_02650 [Candidatus Liptonbacteria bacterium RIFOXYD1_FULL_36_11]